MTDLLGIFVRLWRCLQIYGESGNGDVDSRCNGNGNDKSREDDCGDIDIAECFNK